MLTIQRASAGSGKTYTLARTYITLLLTIPEGAKQRSDSDGNKLLRLRTPAEIADSIRHILAVTFTNKATDEMKQRIMERLADLYAASFVTTLPANKKLWPDYLEYLAGATGADPKDVASAAGIALRSLLYNYSEFNISTIDSFFQVLLRTFAYETDLNDTYQLEIDTKATNTAGVDAALSGAASGENKAAQDWISLLMEEAMNAGMKWDIFQKSESQNSLYTTLLKHIKNMESEDFKENLQKLNSYFAKKPDLLKAYNQIVKAVEGPVEQAWRKAADEALKLKSLFGQAGFDIKEYGSQYLAGNLEKITSGSYDPLKPPTFRAKPFSSKSDVTADVKKSPLKADIEDAYSGFKESYQSLKDLLEGDDYRLWRLYKPLLPYVPLLHIVSEQIHELLKQQNLMQISDTNTLLRKIIGQDETSFIYERLGSRLNHYLIDEFQDTSRMQWENFEPLVSESLSQDFDNLIIGDAKQSIYRFRNAEPALITDTVPNSYPGHRAAGSRPEENTNYRSMQRVVEFNNAFFSYLSGALSEDLKKLYSNVVQPVAKDNGLGYVSINLYTKANTKTFDAESEEKETEDYDGHPAIREAGELVRSFLDRGYAQKDIAFLTVTNKEGRQIIDSLVKFNSGQPADRKIEFISDESLYVANSRAVRTVVATLRAIAEGIAADAGDKTPDSSGRTLSDRRQWRKIASRFAYLASQEPESEPWRILQKIVDGDSAADEISDMLSGMQSTTLPSLTEAIIERFVDKSLREQEAAFLAAFQDAVLGYVESKPTDISSFLQWWDVNATTLSIASPEDIDAVKIMTIHKSKGLEFPVVVIPKADMKFNKLKSRWEWVEPDPGFSYAPELPTVVPIDVSRCKDNKIYGHLYEKEAKKVEMDCLNLAYVAFTRAVNELYVFCPVKKNNAKKDGTVSIQNASLLGNYLLTYLQDGPTIGENACLPLEYEDVTEIPEFTYGSKLTPEEIAALAGKNDSTGKIKREKRKTDKKEIGDYKSSSECGMLKCKPQDEPSSENGSDPRAEGNLMHDIMSRVSHADDLPMAVKPIVISGMVSPDEADAIEARLAAAIATVAGRGWYDGSRRVITERSVVAGNYGKKELKRPDRIMIDPEGNVEIVDYKFGEKTEVKKYHDQVKGYMALLGESGRYKSIKGFLWYVTEGKIEEVVI